MSGTRSRTLGPSGPLIGRISVPADKSISHRAVIFSCLAEGRSVVNNFLAAEDPLRTVEAFRLLGVEIARPNDKELHIHGVGLDGLREPEDIIYCGNSGTTTRLLMGILASRPFFSSLTGDASLRRRPMARVGDPLRAAGADIDGRDGGNRLPLSIRGRRFDPIRYRSPWASAQIKTALILAALFREGESVIEEPALSRDHTERMLPSYGVGLTRGDAIVTIRGPGLLRARDITVPGDFSSAAFFIVAALLLPGSDLTVEGVGVNPTRTGLLDALKAMGANLSLESEREVSGEPVADIRVRHSTLIGTDVRGGLVPRMIDEFPIFCIAAARADGPTAIRDAGELRVKESDRIAAMVSRLRGLGVEVEEHADGMTINGPGTFSSGTFSSDGDHRIAMSMAVAALVGDGAPSMISDVDCVETSFPGFWELLDHARGRREPS